MVPFQKSGLFNLLTDWFLFHVSLLVRFGLPLSESGFQQLWWFMAGPCWLPGAACAVLCRGTAISVAWEFRKRSLRDLQSLLQYILTSFALAWVSKVWWTWMNHEIVCERNWEMCAACPQDIGKWKDENWQQLFKGQAPRRDVFVGRCFGGFASLQESKPISPLFARAIEWASALVPPTPFLWFVRCSITVQVPTFCQASWLVQETVWEVFWARNHVHGCICCSKSCLAASLLGWHDGWRRCEALEGFEGADRQFRKPTKDCLAASWLGWHDGWRRCEALEGIEGAFRKPTKRLSGCELAGLARRLEALRGLGRVWRRQKAVSKAYKKSVWPRACWAGTTAGGAARPWKGLKVPKGSFESLQKECLAASLLSWRDGLRGLGFEGAKRQFRKPTKRLSGCELAGEARRLEALRGLGRVCRCRGFGRVWWLRQSSTPEVVPGAALPWLELGRAGGFF